jgi:hypothetical protein
MTPWNLTYPAKGERTNWEANDRSRSFGVSSTWMDSVALMTGSEGMSGLVDILIFGRMVRVLVFGCGTWARIDWGEVSSWFCGLT